MGRGRQPGLERLEYRDFVRIFEDIGLAAWHGDGRRTSVGEIESLCGRSGLREKLPVFEKGAEQGAVSLLAAFFFRHSGQLSSGERTLGFTHKSFGEYLTARRIVQELVRVVDTELAREPEDRETAWNHQDALVRWVEVTGPCPLAPKFNALHPDVEVRVTGTGPGDAGSQKIYEKLEAQKAAGAETADVDVAVVHQKMAGQMVEEGLLAKYRDDIDTGKLVSRDTAKNALGADVDGYVMPMFHSQTAIAWNPALISEPPQSYAELAEWVKEHPGQFGYNGIREGMSGVAFVVGWLYSNTESPEKLLTGPYDPALKETWSDALASLKEFNQHITFTPSNAGTLDMLNRGEIALGPVWVDMFYTCRPTAAWHRTSSSS